MDSAMYRDHGWDSFGHVSVIVALEKAYGIRIDDDGIQKCSTMRGIRALYEQLLKAS
jgi:acyl carrier protein